VTNAITKLIDESENSLKRSKRMSKFGAGSSQRDFISRILRRLSGVGFSVMIGGGQSVLKPQRNAGP